MADVTNKDKTGDDTLYRLEDLAELAGVSISTVSRALNDSDLVSDRTKKKILALAQSNNYAGRLKDRLYNDAPTKTVTVVVPPPQGRESRLSDPFLLELIGAIGDALRDGVGTPGAEKCDLLISHLDLTDVQSAARMVTAGRTEGLVVLGQSTLHTELNELAALNVPFIVWGAELPGQTYCSVGSDNARGGERATNHLLRLGCQNIAFLGDTDAPEFGLRFEGFRKALDSHGVEFDPRLKRAALVDPDSARDAVEVMLDRGIEFDGIVAASDLVAIGAMRALSANGISVPGDIRVVGYDDVTVAAYTSPALTTIRQDLDKAARLMVRKLFAMMEGEKVPSARLPAELIVRESCGA